MVTQARQEQNICFMDNKNNNLTIEEKAKKYSKGTNNLVVKYIKESTGPIQQRIVQIYGQ